MFEQILNDLEGVGKEDKSKIGTMAGSPRGLKQKLAADFNSEHFENAEYEKEDFSSSSSSEESEKEQQPEME